MCDTAQRQGPQPITTAEWALYLILVLFSKEDFVICVLLELAEQQPNEVVIIFSPLNVWYLAFLDITFSRHW